MPLVAPPARSTPGPARAAAPATQSRGAAPATQSRAAATGGRRAQAVRERAAPGAGPGPGRQGAGSGRGRDAAAGPRRAADRPAQLRVPDQGRRPGGGWPARRHHLLAQGLHPADQAVPGPLRLLHLRHGARPAAQPLPVAGRGHRDRRRRRRAGLQGGPVHPGRPARGPLAPGPRVAGRARLRRHPVLRPGDGDPGARGDRPAAAPQPRRAVLAGLPAAQAGRAVDGDDAGDHRGAAVHRAGRARISAARTRTRRSGSGCWRTPAAATSRSPPGS